MSPSLSLMDACQPVCHTCSILQHLSSAGIYIHPPTTLHLSLDLWGPLFPIKPLAPTYQSHVRTVISCVCPYLRSPHPIPKSRIRVQSVWETRSCPLLCALALSLSLSPWLLGCAVVAMRMKVNTWAFFPFLFLTYRVCSQKNHMNSLFCESDQNMSTIEFLPMHLGIALVFLNDVLQVNSKKKLISFARTPWTPQ